MTDGRESSSREMVLYFLIFFLENTKSLFSKNFFSKITNISKDERRAEGKECGSPRALAESFSP